MNRNSNHAKRLSATLVKEGYNAIPRRLERWCLDGLGPAADTNFSVQVAHFAQLTTISKSGRDADAAARRLAARGYACERLRSALLDELDIPPVAGPPSLGALDLSSGPSGDPGFAAVEHLAEWMTADTVGLPPLMVRIVQTLRRNAERHAAEIGEQADVIFQSFVVNALCHLLGGEFYNGRALEAVCNLEHGDITPEVLDVINATMRLTPRAF